MKKRKLAKLKAQAQGKICCISYAQMGVLRRRPFGRRIPLYELIISDTAFAGQSSTKVDSFIIAGIEFMFGLALVALNAKGPKLIKNPILVVWLGALYCAYFWIYKNSRGNYPYSPYHLMNDYYLQL